MAGPMSSSFVELVREMREGQKRYFRDRTQTALRESKRLEQEVDERVKFLQVNNPPLRQEELPVSQT
jgi:hypothetical protein